MNPHFLNYFSYRNLMETFYLTRNNNISNTISLFQNYFSNQNPMRTFYLTSPFLKKLTGRDISQYNSGKVIYTPYGIIGYDDYYDKNKERLIATWINGLPYKGRVIFDDEERKGH